MTTLHSKRIEVEDEIAVLTEPLAFEAVSLVKNGRALNSESRRRQRHHRPGLSQRRQNKKPELVTETKSKGPAGSHRPLA
jgi:hypothetical protein